jgi:hypothetical protein
MSSIYTPYQIRWIDFAFALVAAMITMYLLATLLILVDPSTPTEFAGNMWPYICIVAAGSALLLAVKPVFISYRLVHLLLWDRSGLMHQLDPEKFLPKVVVRMLVYVAFGSIILHIIHEVGYKLFGALSGMHPVMPVSYLILICVSALLVALILTAIASVAVWGHYLGAPLRNRWELLIAGIPLLICACTADYLQRCAPALVTVYSGHRAMTFTVIHWDVVGLYLVTLVTGVITAWILYRYVSSITEAIRSV